MDKHKAPWKTTEVAYLKARYAKDGSRVLAAKLGRTPGAIKSMARDVGIGIFRAWTEEEIAILKERYPDGGCRECMPFLPGRTWRAIQSKATHLNVHARKWSQRELAILKKHYPKGGARECVRHLDRTKHAVVQMAIDMGIKFDGHLVRPPRVSLTRERQDEMLKLLAAGFRQADIARAMELSPSTVSTWKKRFRKEGRLSGAEGNNYGP